MADSLGYLSLAKKAGRVEIGEAKAKDAAASGKAVLFIAGNDCSEPTLERIERMAQRYNVPLCIVPQTKDDLFWAVGKAGCMAAFTDIGLACAYMDALSSEDEAFAPQAEIMRNKKATSPAPSKSATKNIGKRKHR